VDEIEPGESSFRLHFADQPMTPSRLSALADSHGVVEDAVLLGKPMHDQLEPESNPDAAQVDKTLKGILIETYEISIST